MNINYVIVIHVTNERKKMYRKLTERKMAETRELALQKTVSIMDGLQGSLYASEADWSKRFIQNHP